MTICVYLIGTVILNQDRYKVLHLTCFYKYHSLIFGQLLTGFDGVVYPVAKKDTDINRFYEIYAAEINKNRKVYMFFTGFLCFISYDNIKKAVACMDIVFIICNLCAQLLCHPACLIRSLTALQYKQVVFHIVVDRAYAFLVFELVLIIGILLLELCDLHLVTLFLLPEIQNILGVHKNHHKNSRQNPKADI